MRTRETMTNIELVLGLGRSLRREAAPKISFHSLKARLFLLPGLKTAEVLKAAIWPSSSHIIKRSLNSTHLNTDSAHMAVLLLLRIHEDLKTYSPPSKSFNAIGKVGIIQLKLIDCS